MGGKHHFFPDRTGHFTIVGMETRATGRGPMMHRSNSDRCLRDRLPPSATPRYGIDDLEVLVTCYEPAGSGRCINLNATDSDDPTQVKMGELT